MMDMKSELQQSLVGLVVHGPTVQRTNDVEQRRRRAHVHRRRLGKVLLQLLHDLFSPAVGQCRGIPSAGLVKIQKRHADGLGHLLSILQMHPMAHSRGHLYAFSV